MQPPPSSKDSLETTHLRVPSAQSGTRPLRLLLLAAGLCALTLLPYLNSFDAEFIFDSEAHVKFDPRLRTPRAADPFYSIVADARDLVFRPEGFEPFSRVKSWFGGEPPQPFWGAIFSSHYWHCQSAFYDLFYRPLVTLSYYLNFQALGYGEVPQPDSEEYFWLKLMFHGTNWLIHLVNVLVVFFLLRKLFVRHDRAPWGTTTAFIAAAFFAVHPVQTESVTNIVGRADLMAMFFVLGGFYCHIRSRESRGAGAWFWMAAAAAALLLGLLTKESSIVLVAVAALYDLTLAPRAKRDRNVWMDFLTARRIFGFTAMLCVIVFFLIVRAWVFRPLDPSYVDGLNNPLVDTGLVEGRLTALKVMGKQLYLLMFPWRLSPDYSYNAIPVFSFDFSQCATRGDFVRLLWENSKCLIALLGFAAMGVFAWKMRRRRPLLTFAAAALVATMIPTSNLLLEIGTIMADRFLYLPSIWFCALAASAIIAGSQRLTGQRAAVQVLDLHQPLRFGESQRLTGQRAAVQGQTEQRAIGGWTRRAAAAAAAAAAFLVLAGGVRTFLRNIDWRSTQNLWSSAVLAYPQSAKTHVNYANSLHQAMMRDGLDEAKLDEAIHHSEQAWAMKKYATFGANLGAFYILKADRMLESALRSGGTLAAHRVAPQTTQLYQRGLQVLLESVEDEQRMVEIIHRELRKKGKPLHLSKAHGNPSVYQNLGTAFLKLNDLPNAERAFRHAADLEPFSGARMALADVLLRMNRLEDAAVVLWQVVLLDARNAIAARTINQIYSQLLPGLATLLSANPQTGAFSISHPAPPPQILEHLRAALLNLVRQLAAVNEMALALQFKEVALKHPYNAPPERFNAVINQPVIPVAPRFGR